MKTKELAKKLSGGMQRRLNLAMALITNPQVLFLDEPTSNIDISSAAEIEKYIRSINETKNLTIIMFPLNLFKARHLPDEVLFIHEGHIIEQGGKNIFEQPRDQRTSAFLRGETFF